MLTSLYPLLPPPPPLPPSSPTNAGTRAPTSSSPSRWSLSTTLLIHTTATPTSSFPPPPLSPSPEPEDLPPPPPLPPHPLDDDQPLTLPHPHPHPHHPHHPRRHHLPHHPTDVDDEEEEEEDDDEADEEEEDDAEAEEPPTDDDEGTAPRAAPATLNPPLPVRRGAQSRSPSPASLAMDEEESAGLFLSLTPYQPFSSFSATSSPSAASTCDCHRTSLSRLSTVPVASPSAPLFPPPTSSPPSHCSRPSCSLLSALSSLRASTSSSDVCFLTGGSLPSHSVDESKDSPLTPSPSSSSPGVERIYAHRTVLSSRSSVFDRMLNNGKMMESTHRRSGSGSSLGGAGDEGEEGDVLMIVVPDITPVAFRLMLDFIYLDAAPSPAMTEKVADTALHYPSLLYASIKYDLPRLQGAVRTALHTVVPSIACQLWQSLRAMREDDLADKYHLHILQHAAALIKTDGFLSLPYPLLLQLVQDDRLQVSELALFKALYRWMDHHTDGVSHNLASSLAECKEESRTEQLDQQFKQQLLPYVRFPLMTAREMAVHVAPTGLLTDAELAALFIHISSNQLTPAPAGFNATPRVACPSIIPLTYHHDGDEHGLIYWLGTCGYSQPFSNPHTSLRCAITLSSCQFGQPSALTSRRRDVQLWTHNRSSSWLELDIDPANSGLLLVPSHISLQHGYDRPLDCLASWTLEASIDRWEWDTLLEKRGVVAFREGYERRTWALPVSVVKGYRMFRIRGTGKDSSERTEYVCVGGIELYGELQVQQPPLRKREEEEHKMSCQGEKRQREEAPTDERPERRPVERPLDDADDPAIAAADDDGRVSDVTAAVDEERRCWKAARQCTLM